MGVVEGKEREKKHKFNLKLYWLNTSQIQWENKQQKTNLYIQKAQESPSRTNIKRFTSRYIIGRLSKAKDKGTIFKTGKRKMIHQVKEPQND